MNPVVKFLPKELPIIVERQPPMRAEYVSAQDRMAHNPKTQELTAVTQIVYRLDEQVGDGRLRVIIALTIPDAVGFPTEAEVKQIIQQLGDAVITTGRSQTVKELLAIACKERSVNSAGYWEDPDHPMVNETTHA